MARRSSKRERTLKRENADFLSGRSDRISLPRAPVELGYSLVQRTAAGAGSHGKAGRARSKADRRRARLDLARGDY